MKKTNLFYLLTSTFIFALVLGCTSKEEQYYSFSDYLSVEKVDAHFHYRNNSSSFIRFAEEDNFKLLSPNIDGGNLEIIDRDYTATDAIYRRHHDRFAYFTTFYSTDFEKPGFADEVIARIKSHIEAGAAGVKIWKNLGMVVKDKEGNYIMADNPVFDPIYSFLEENNIPMMAHIGEPRDCWLPLEEMVAPNNRNYYKSNPQYHAYLLPEIPSYEEQIRARDNIMEKHPQLNFIGAHIGSEEWSVDKIAATMDKYPNMKIDLSARILNLQAQSIKEYDAVRNFLIKYSNRIMYGSDYAASYRDTVVSERNNWMKENWQNDWIYYATDSVFQSSNFNCEIKGLRLPKDVIDKIYHDNAIVYFKSNATKLKKMYKNPVVGYSLPDPTIILADDGYFYLYATEDIRHTPIHRSKNLIDWEKIGTAFTPESRPTFVPKGGLWAPDINYVNGQYLLYYSLSRWGELWINGIGVAVAEKPEGPFVDKGPLFISKDIEVGNSIDQFFVEENGKKLLFWGSFFGIYVIELSDDGLSVKNGAEKIKVAGDIYEGTSIHKHDNYYYLFASIGKCCEGVNSTYTTVVGRSANLFGPYLDKKGNSMLENNHEILIKGNEHFVGTGHNSEIVSDKEGNDWIFYHAVDLKNPSGRVLMLDRVQWKDGWPEVSGNVPSSKAKAPVF